MGTHPCVRCLIPLKDIRKLGMISDISFRVREKSMRTCNEHILRAIAVARKTIYQDKCQIDDKFVAETLDQWSLAPIEVINSL